MKKLGTLDVCGTDWGVWEATGAEFETMGNPNAEGVCSHTECAIYLLNTCRKDRKDTLMHEYLHAVLQSSGALYGLLSSLGVPFIGKKSDALEETFVRVLTPHIIRTLGSPKIKRCPS